MHSALGSKLSPIVNRTDTPSPFFFREYRKEFCTELRSGMTCKRSAEKCCRQLTLFSEDSHARISVLQELERVWRESAVVFSSKSSAWSKNAIPALCSSKTSQRFALVDFLKSSTPLQKWGMTVGGLVYLPQALEPRTSVNDGSYLPTPTAQSYGSNQGGAAGRKGKVRYSLDVMAKKNLWPTPTVCGNYQQKGNMIGLATAVKMWPTPCARDWKDSPGQKNRGKRDESKLAPRVYLTNNGGQLNPQWVEWLMGYPIGWTELNAWAIAWYQPKSGKRSKSYQESEM